MTPAKRCAGLVLVLGPTAVDRDVVVRAPSGIEALDLDESVSSCEVHLLPVPAGSRAWAARRSGWWCDDEAGNSHDLLVPPWELTSVEGGDHGGVDRTRERVVRDRGVTQDRA